MKHFLTLLFILFFSFSLKAAYCPADKPLQGKDGVCYSCDEPSVVIINEAALGKWCHQICPNRKHDYSEFNWKDWPAFSDGTTETCKMYTSLEEYHNQQKWLTEQLGTPFGRFKYLYLTSSLFYLNTLLCFFILNVLFRLIGRRKSFTQNQHIKTVISIVLAFFFSILTIEFRLSGLFSLLLLFIYAILKMIEKEGKKPVLTRILIVFLIFFLLYGLPGLIHALFFK